MLAEVPEAQPTSIADLAYGPALLSESRLLAERTERLREVTESARACSYFLA